MRRPSKEEAEMHNEEESSFSEKAPLIVETAPSVNGEGPNKDVKERNWRDLVAFWICGLLNNFGYVVMLSAADDMLGDRLSPSIVLLADIFPSLVIQMISPWFAHLFPYWSRVIITVVLAVLSFLLPALCNPLGLKLLGVVCASISSGFGELTFLSYSARFHKDTVSAWSSGTGGAGILGSFSYLGLSYLLSPKYSLLVSSPLPIGIALCYFFIMTEPATLVEVVPEVQVTPVEPAAPLPMKHRLVLLVKLLPFMVPLALVYFGEYLINQSIVGVITYPKSWFHGKEYKYYQALYQIGVFVSRSSVNFIPIKTVLLLQFPAIFQMVNALFLSFVAIYDFIPSIYIIFAIIFWEGLLGGSIYVNTFYLISQRFTGKEKEFCLGATSQAYGLSITLCALVGIPYYPLLQHWRKKKGHD